MSYVFDGIDDCSDTLIHEEFLLLAEHLYASTPNLRNHGDKTSLKPANRPKETDSHSALLPWKHIDFDLDEATHLALLREPAVARQFSGRAQFAQTALVNGAAGAVWAPRGQPRVVFGFTITRGKIVEIDLIADPERLRQIDLTVLGD